MFKRAFVIVAITMQFFWIHSAMAESVQFDIAAFTVEGNTLLSDDRIRQVLMPFTGKDRVFADVNKAVDALQSLYQKAGYAVVKVTAPVQSVHAGIVVLKVLEDKVASLEVQGNSVYQADNIRASLPLLQVGKSINAQRLEAAIALANENSAKQIAVNVQPGVKIGELNTRIDVSEDRMSKWMTTVDNAGSAATGYTKLGIAYQHANLFNRDHALTVQYNASPQALDKVGSVNVGYHIPVYQYGLSWDLITAYSSSATQNGAIYFAGKGLVLGARLNYALNSWGDLRHKVILGLDYKDSNNNFTNCVAPCTSVSEQPLSLTYFAQAARPDFQASGSVSWLANVTGSAQGGAANYQSARATLGTLAATPAWQAWRLSLTGAAPLPMDWQVRAVVNGQYSRDLLLPAEQFGAGGATSVRGYPERAVAGERGYASNIEIYTPDFNKYLSLPNESFRALFFWDTARVTLNDQFPTGVIFSPHTYLSSVGMGVRVVHKKDVNIKFDLGWAQKPAGFTKKNDVRGHIAISLVF